MTIEERLTDRFNRFKETNNIVSFLKKNGIFQKNLCQLLNIKETTLSYKLRNGALTWSEISKLKKEFEL